MTSSDIPILTPDSASPDPKAQGPFASMRRAIPSGEVIRFLLVGGFNTFFSFVLYSGCVVSLGHLFPSFGKPLIADIAFAMCTPIGITLAFLLYKNLVFRTKGNFLKEWFRCFVVYSFTFPAALVILPAATHFFQRGALTYEWAPYLAGLVNSFCIACYSYFGHKKFSFRR